MEIGTEKAKDYILALKEAGNFTFEDIANLSGIPLQTVRNICSGKTPDARFGTIAKIVISLGGDLNDLVGNDKKKEIELNSTVSLKETYEMRISDLIDSYDRRIEDIKELCEMRIVDVQRCCEARIADIKKNYEERIANQKEFLRNQK
jgi:transcriptional regulator with XRE-family HTH domain